MTTCVIASGGAIGSGGRADFVVQADALRVIDHGQVRLSGESGPKTCVIGAAPAPVAVNKLRTVLVGRQLAKRMPGIFPLYQQTLFSFVVEGASKLGSIAKYAANRLS